MDTAEKLDFVRQNHHAILVTRRANGQVQTSPIVCGVDADGKVAISVTVDRAKTRNVRRDPQVALCVLDDAFFGPWVQIDGTAEVVDLPEAMEGLVALYRAISGEHPDWDEYRRSMTDQGRCLIRITPT